MIKRNGTAAVAFLALLLVALAPVGAARGADWADPGFGIGGVAEPLLSADASTAEAGISDLAVAPDGTTVGALKGLAGSGYFGAVRLTATGALDPSFGQGGYADPFGLAFEGFNLEAQAEAVAVQGDGKVVAVGAVQEGIHRPTAFSPLLVRYEVDGSLDPSFGGSGVLAPRPFGSGGTVLHDVSVAPDGRIVVVGGRNENSRGVGAPAGIVAAYRPDGSRDTTFGDGGRVAFKGGYKRSYSSLRAMRILDDGKILVAGYRDYKLFLARLTPSGKRDRSFGGGDGFATVDIHSGICCPSAALGVQADGRVVVAIKGGSLHKARVFLARFLPAGGLDRGFGDGGVEAPFRSWRLSEVTGLAIQADGGILTTGRGDMTKANPHGFTYAAFRNLPDGSPDPGFGRNGLLNIPRGGQSLAGAALAQPDGSVLTGGSFASVSPATGRYVTTLLLARFLGSSP